AHVLEVGPGRTLLALLRAGRGDQLSGSRFLPTTGGERGTALQAALAQLWADGVPVSAWEEDGARGYRRVVVPGYPYQRRRFWVEPTDLPVPSGGPAPDATAARAPAPLPSVDAPARVRAADLDRQLAAGVEVLFATLRAAAAVQRRLRVPVRLAVLGRGLVDVTGGESVNPASAAVLGLLRSAELEVPGLRCQL